MTKLNIYNKLPQIVKSMFLESEIESQSHAVTLCESMLDSIYGNQEEYEMKKDVSQLKRFINKYK
jgi:propanediol utilization protein